MTTFKRKKNLISVLVSIVVVTMLLLCLTLTAKAVEVEVGAFKVAGGEKGTDYKYENNVLIIIKDTPLTIKNIDPNTSTTDRIVVKKDISANITLNGVNIDTSMTAFKIADNSAGHVVITLADGSTNILKSGTDHAGLEKNDNTSIGTLTIKGETNGTGFLSATGGENGAGIGGGYVCDTTNITISGGTVVATGTSGGAGIGGGHTGVGTNIAITGGTVTAIGGENGAGIGGGAYRTATGITITGGSVKAIAGTNANTFGGGRYENAVTPTNGSDYFVYLLTIKNANSDDVYINGVKYTPKNHSTADSIDTNLYAYLAAGTYTVKVGDAVTTYTYVSGKWHIECDLIVTDTESGVEVTSDNYYSFNQTTGVLTVNTSQAITIKNKTVSTPTTNRIEIKDEVSPNITLAGVNIDVSSSDNTAAFNIPNNHSKDVTITLANNATNTLKSGASCAGLQKNCDTSTGKLTIQGEGTLSAIGGVNGAGIGGGKNGAGSNITISSGTIIATGGASGAGIGGGYNGMGTAITIKGGKVTTTGGSSGAGIGGGRSALGSEITIESGKITAAGGKYAAGIGGGYNSIGTDITISGGEVKAEGGSLATGIGGGCGESVDAGAGSNITISNATVKATGGEDGAGIGGGFNSAGSNIKINSGEVTATGGTNGAGIGGGRGASGSNITISGGTVTAEGGASGAGIGGGHNGTGTAITIKGGKVTATGGSSGAGIGGGRNGKGSDITIESGEVKATSVNYGAGIGGGYNSIGIDITISGGEVTAEGGSNGAGIGGGYAENVNASASTNITISGGKIIAKGGQYSAGIGGGTNGAASNIKIGGGEVKAEGGSNGAGIGGGNNGTGSSIIISDGKVITTGGNLAAGIGGGHNKTGSDIEISGGEVTTKGGSSGAGIGGGRNCDGLNITISGGKVTTTGGHYAAGIGGGYYGSGLNINILGGEVVSTGGRLGAGIGGGQNGEGIGVDENGVTLKITIKVDSVKVVAGENANVIGGGNGKDAVIPTNGTEDVYLLVIENPNDDDIKINGVDYLDSHGNEPRIYAYLPAKTAFDPNIISIGGNTTEYCYTTHWRQVIDSVPTADTTIFTYDGTEKTYTLAESGYYTVLGNKKTNAGTYEVTASIKDSYIWNDGTTVKTYNFVINKATPTVELPTASTITYGDALSSSTLSGGWSWKDGTIIPTVQNSGYSAKIAVDDKNYNYEDVEGYDRATSTVTRTIAVKVNQATPPTVELPTASTITYGDALSSSTLSGGWSWEDGTEIPTVQNSGYSAKIAVDDKNYNYEYIEGYDRATSTVTRTIAVKVNQATPTVELPTASTITYGDALSSSTLSGGWIWKDGKIIPTVQNSGYNAVMTVTDYPNYDYSNLNGYTYNETEHTLTCVVDIVVRKAIPLVVIEPTASTITYGATLSTSELTDTAWSWVDGAIIPTVINNGYDAEITVDDSNYDYQNVKGYSSAKGTVTRTIALTVNKAAPPTVEIPTSSTITYGDALSQSNLSGGWSWEDGTVVPTVGNYVFDAVTRVDDVNYDYSNVDGYDKTTGTVTTTVTVTVNKAIPTIIKPTATEVTYGRGLSNSRLNDGWSWVDGTIIPTVQNSGYNAVKTVTDYDYYDYSNLDGYTYDETTHKLTHKVSVTVNKAIPTITVTANPVSQSAGKTITVTATAKNPNNEALADFTTVTCIYKIGNFVNDFTGSFTIPKGTPVGTQITIIALTNVADNYALGMETTIITVVACEHEDTQTDWSSDNTNHWCYCICGEQVNKTTHIDENRNGKCDVCDYDVDVQITTTTTTRSAVTTTATETTITTTTSQLRPTITTTLTQPTGTTTTYSTTTQTIVNPTTYPTSSTVDQSTTTYSTVSNQTTTTITVSTQSTTTQPTATTTTTQPTTTTATTTTQLTTTTTTQPTTQLTTTIVYDIILKGDVNRDNKISIEDVRIIVVAIANGKQDELLELLGDVNDDGRVSVADARKLVVAIDKNDFDSLIIKKEQI